jgi:2-methylcitrate dehydratase PrpD
MNLFYGLAVIALHRDASVRQYDERRLADPAIVRFIERISAYEDAGLEAMGPPFRHACRLTLTTLDGRTFAHERLARRGSPEDAVGEAEIVRKYAANVSGILTAEQADGLREEVMRLDEVDDTRHLTARLRSEPGDAA